MRKFVLLSALALGLVVVAPVVTTPASAQGIYQGGSHEPGLVPWRGRTSLGPYGVQRRHYAPRRAHSPRRAYYRGQQQGQMRQQRVRAHHWSRTTTRRVHIGTGWEVVNKTGVGRSIPPTDSRCWTLPNGTRRCPNI